MKKESCENHEQTLLLYVTIEKGLSSMSIATPEVVRRMTDTVTSQETCLNLADYAYTIPGSSRLTSFYSSPCGAGQVCHVV